MTDADDTLLSVRGVSKRYTTDLDQTLRHGAADMLRGLRGRSRDSSRPLRRHEFWAVRDVSFDVGRGEATGVIGRNGAGKSTLLRLVAGITKPDEGSIRGRGRVGALLDPSANLDPLLTGRENARSNAAYAAMDRRSLHRRVGWALDFAELEEFADAPVNHYSQGMRMRLGFSIVAALQPEVLLVDEALSVGDVAFRLKCAEHIQRHIHEGGGLVLVSHSVYAVQALCQHAIVLDRGTVSFAGEPAAAVGAYLGSTAGMEKAATDEVAVDDLADGSTADDEAHDGAPVPHEVRSVRLEQVTEPEGEVRTGVPTTLVVEVASVEGVERVDWAFMIWTGDQQTSLTGSLVTGPDIALRPGRTRLAADIGPLALHPGTYLVRVAVLECRSGVPLAMHGWTDAPTAVHVEPPIASDPDPLHVLSGSPLATMNVTWSADQEVDQVSTGVAGT